MSDNGRYFDEVHGYLTEHGESGVNPIARATGIPLSTLHNYLKKQTYFKQTERQKWTLPENVANEIKGNTLVLTVDSVENALLMLRSQIGELEHHIETALMPIKTLKRSVKQFKTPVATKLSDTLDIDPRLVEIDKVIKVQTESIKTLKSSMGAEYADLILNIDYVALMLDKGGEYVDNVFNIEVGGYVVGQTTELSDDIIEMINQYQKKA